MDVLYLTTGEWRRRHVTESEKLHKETNIVGLWDQEQTTGMGRTYDQNE